MNKLPWFPHEHDARNDDFIQEAEERFGHFGYAGWFKILEILHQHGNGPNLEMGMKRLARRMRSRPPAVRQLLDFCQSAGKLIWREDGVLATIQINKVIVKWKNLRNRSNSKESQPDTKSPIDREKEIDIDKPPIPPKGDGVTSFARMKDFEKFWSVYPRKVGKLAATKKWGTTIVGKVFMRVILGALELQCDSNAWLREDGQYIPHPTTWLNRGGWLDEVNVMTRSRSRPKENCLGCPAPAPKNDAYCAKCRKAGEGPLPETPQDAIPGAKDEF